MSAPMSFFPRPALGEARTIPAARPPVAKRVASSHITLPAKRVKHAPSPLSISTTAEKENLPTRDLLTPQPSSDGPSDAHMFKIPSIPARLAPLTPTTSTVAASSSPRRAFPSSSPGKTAKSLAPETQMVLLESGTTLVFGRHHVRGAHRPDRTRVPPVLAPRLAHPDAPARTIVLDRGARHASRVHAAAELVAAGGRTSIRLAVLGQNGLRVRENGKLRRLLSGVTESFSADKNLEIDFYGARVLLTTEDPDETEDERLFTPEPEEVQEAASPLSLPPSSPPAFNAVLEESDEELSEVEENAPAEADATLYETARSSSPLSEPDRASSPRASSPPTISVEVKTELVETARKSRPSTPQIEYPPLPDGVDIAALLASTVVFSGSSKLSLPDLVKSLLESQPSMRDHGSEQVWAHWAGEELESNAMFGKITRNGRDASGRPLLAHYFYNPANDPDASRAAELGGLVRPLRAAQRGGGKAIDWRPVGAGRRRYY